MNKPNPNWILRKKFRKGLINSIPAIALQAAIFLSAILVPSTVCFTESCSTYFSNAFFVFGLILSIATVGYFFQGFFKED
jgi:hypothetical protein